MIPSFADRRRAWSSPPVDDVGYMLSSELLSWDDADLLELIGKMAQARYGGWRNYEMRWRLVLGLDRTHDLDVLDYGCGVGLEAIQYAKLGNRVSVADISPDNVKLAKRLLALEGHKCKTYTIANQSPFIITDQAFDIIHCAGVLHHIPEPEPVVEFMASILRKEGQLRLMLYSDKAWKIATGTEPPRKGDISEHPEFERYWQHWDPIGGYADWYDEQRLEERFGKWFSIWSCEPLTENGAYIGSVLIKR